MKANVFIDYFRKKKELPQMWERLLDILVMDPDGWDRRNFDIDWNKKLSLKDFLIKASESTCQYSQFYIDVSELFRKGYTK